MSALEFQSFKEKSQFFFPSFEFDFSLNPCTQTTRILNQFVEMISRKAPLKTCSLISSLERHDYSSAADCLLKNPHLCTLKLTRGKLSSDEFLDLLKLSSKSGLENLCLTNIRIYEESKPKALREYVASFKEILSTSNLKSLSLKGCIFEDPDFQKVLCEVQESPSLLKLSLSFDKPAFSHPYEEAIFKELQENQNFLKTSLSEMPSDNP